MFTVDDHFQITSFNNAGERITDVRREEAIGNKCHDVFRENICQKQCALRATLETGTPKHDIHVDVVNADMDAVPIEISTAVKAVLDNVGWNREKDANRRSVSRTTLWRWMKQKGLA